MRTTDGGAGVVVAMRPRRPVARAMVACLVLVGVTATACSDTTTGSDTATDDAVEIVFAHDDVVYALDSVKDVVEVAGAVVLVKVNSERIDPLSAEDQAMLDVLPVTKRNYYDVTISDVIWAGEKSAFSVGDSFELFGNGALFKGERSDRFHPHLSVGDQYVIAIRTFPKGISAFNPDAVSPVDAAGNLTDWTYGSDTKVSSALASLPDEPIDTVGALSSALELASRS